MKILKIVLWLALSVIAFFFFTGFWAVFVGGNVAPLFAIITIVIGAGIIWSKKATRKVLCYDCKEENIVKLNEKEFLCSKCGKGNKIIK